MLLCDDNIWALPDGASGIEFKDKEALEIVKLGEMSQEEGG